MNSRKKIKFLDAARTDLLTERKYYGSIHPLLASQFVEAVRHVVQAIADRPLAMQLLEGGFRRWPVEGFPHGVLYKVEEEIILVLAVFHPKQDPHIWHGRG